MSYTLSPSRLRLFQECRKCFWLETVHSIKRPQGFASSLPSGIDAVLKDHFDLYRELGSLPPELAIEGLDDYHLFDDRETLSVWRTNSQGLRYRDFRSGILLRGAIDALLVKDTQYVILDFKTRGYARKPKTHTYYQSQLDVYAFLLEQNGYEPADHAFLLFYCPAHVTDETTFVFDTDLVTMSVDPRAGERLFQRAVTFLRQKQEPPHNPECRFCQWRYFTTS